MPESEHLDLDAAAMGRPDEDITTVLDLGNLVALRWERSVLTARSTRPTR